ncbi:hypothetical protein CB0940_02014 [Cercospora beticola]|uniref:RGS domain-containing protein n=1 Tax=Cercospora beticola TaxID=122368 RepID=A0A2G5IAC7_CERBT|nr:hypothetical protein CB0940_02014 [Cercospora beticola]PIB01700.1 hypothetical protein CB0940_02014 [Cercospora beticola]WPA97484.1 hypothetical protein RHO25_002094 [Cercospora beticola]
MVYNITYRRPSKVQASSSDSINGDEKQKSINESIESGNSGMSHGIPAALSFDRIIAGGTCPPVTLREFMNYLKYIEYAAENLQFFLWYKDYASRWEQLKDSEKALSPEWTIPPEADMTIPPARPKRVPAQIAAVLKDTDFADAPKQPVERPDPFNMPPKSGSFEDKREFDSDYAMSMSDDKTLLSSTNSNNHQSVTNHAFDEAGMKWKPFTSQAYRDEVSRIVSIYIAEGSPRELNLSSRERQAVLHALQHTTHPSAFNSIVTSVDFSLRKQAHPNFIRWTICNGNRSRVIFARGLGIFLILAAFIADLLITLSSAGRGWRVLPIIGWLLGISTLIAAWKGMCVVLHGLHHRHIRPWELFTDETEEQINEKFNSKDGLVSESRNSFEEEPWVPRYKKRNIIRKIFDREVWIQEPALRQIQDTIFLQSLLGAFVASVIVVGIFCAVPHGNLF